MRAVFLLQLATGALGLLGGVACYNLTERFAWRVLDFTYPDERTRAEAIHSGEFIPENSLPVGIDVWRNKMFITIPRWKEGVPATLTYIPLDVSYSPSPKLTPYPNWETNRAGHCGGLTNTNRARVDKCDRLWVLDSGTVGIEETTQQLCPTALHVFDLKTDRLIRRYEYHPEDTNKDTFIANIAVDVGHSCEDTHVYASDELGYGLIVYSYEKNDSWRVEHGFFRPDPLAGDFNIGGLNFQWDAEGVFGMALSPPSPLHTTRTLFFHSLASNREFAVSTHILKDKELSENSYQDFEVLKDRGTRGHVTAQVMTHDGILFFNLIDQNGVGCWNSENPYSPEYHAVIAKDDVGLIFPSDVRVDDNNILWVMSDRMPTALISTLDHTDINFRVYYTPVVEAIYGTVCDKNVNYNNPRKLYYPESNYDLSNLPNALYKVSPNYFRHYYEKQ